MKTGAGLKRVARLERRGAALQVVLGRLDSVLSRLGNRRSVRSEGHDAFLDALLVDLAVERFGHGEEDDGRRIGQRRTDMRLRAELALVGVEADRRCALVICGGEDAGV